MFDHWIRTVLLDLVRVLGETDRETWEYDEIEKWRLQMMMKVRVRVLENAIVGSGRRRMVRKFQVVENGRKKQGEEWVLFVLSRLKILYSQWANKYTYH